MKVEYDKLEKLKKKHVKQISFRLIFFLQDKKKRMEDIVNSLIDKEYNFGFVSLKFEKVR